MRILLCHNYYRYFGGEDASFEAEAVMLENRGHAVRRFTRHNAATGEMGRLSLARRTVWNRDTYNSLRAAIQEFRPEVMHCTNTFPLLSPAAYDAACELGVPVVQALRNYRLICPRSDLVRNGRVCEDCLGRAVPWPAVRHGCYRESRAASAVVAGMLTYHRARATWAKRVNLYFTLTDFARNKYIEAGWPAEQIAVKGNFVSPDLGFESGALGQAVYVGRLSQEKGIDTLLAAWRRLRNAPLLQIIGEGPLEKQVKAAVAESTSVEWLGKQPMRDVLEILGQASCLILPSICYETFGRTIIEAFSRGTPAIVSRHGAMAELVDEGRTGFLFTPGDADDLARNVMEFMSDPRRVAEMRRAARAEFEERYTEEANYRQLCDIYARAGARSANGGASDPIPGREESEVSNEIF